MKTYHFLFPGADFSVDLDGSVPSGFVHEIYEDGGPIMEQIRVSLGVPEVNVYNSSVLESRYDIGDQQLLALTKEYGRVFVIFTASIELVPPSMNI